MLMLSWMGGIVIFLRFSQQLANREEQQYRRFGMLYSTADKLCPSRFKVPGRISKINSRDSDCHVLRFKTELQENLKPTLFHRFSTDKPKKIPTKFRDLKTLLLDGQNQRKSLFMNLNSPFRPSTSESSKKSKIKKSQKQAIKQILRNSINRSHSGNKVEYKKKQKWIKQSFTKVVKDLKHRQKVHLDKQNQNKTKIESYGATIKGEKHHVNQDSLIFSEGIYIICDGHGTNGKQISQFVSQTAHKFLVDAYAEKKIDSRYIRNALKKTELELDISGIDISFSGCTFLGMVIFENCLFSISVGDSRAFMGHGITTSELNVMHKPDYPHERARIENSGGIIHPLQIGKDKYSGPNRIWAPGKNSWGPGLALSRAFGDKAARKYGLISEPEIKNIRLTYEIDFILMGSDGLFDFLKDSELSYMVRKKLKEEQNRESIALQLVEQAKRSSGFESDDISCILILL